MLNIVIPMAGQGSRFAQAGYKDPKPLIPIEGKPMIQWVVNNVRPSQPHRFIFIVQQAHLEAYPTMATFLETIAPGSSIVPIDGITEGAACTVLTAKSYINNDQPLMIANSDQFIDCDINNYLADIQGDGLIMTFPENDPKWSYCKMNHDNTVNEVFEKQVVSHEATTGIYNFTHGSEFVNAAESMIKQNIRVNGEFYVAPTFNQLIAKGAKIFISNIGANAMHGLGTPEDLQLFLKTETCRDYWQNQLSSSTS